MGGWATCLGWACTIIAGLPSLLVWAANLCCVSESMNMCCWADCFACDNWPISCSAFCLSSYICLFIYVRCVCMSVNLVNVTISRYGILLCGVYNRIKIQRTTKNAHEMEWYMGHGLLDVGQLFHRRPQSSTLLRDPHLLLRGHVSSLITRGCIDNKTKRGKKQVYRIYKQYVGTSISGATVQSVDFEYYLFTFLPLRDIETT